MKADKSIRKTFDLACARHLKAWREGQGLSRPQVAEKMRQLLPAKGETGFDQATVFKWETGRTSMRGSDIVLLAKVYNVEPCFLLINPADRGRLAAVIKLMKVLRQMEPDTVLELAEQAETTVAKQRAARLRRKRAA